MLLIRGTGCCRFACLIKQRSQLWTRQSAENVKLIPCVFVVLHLLLILLHRNTNIPPIGIVLSFSCVQLSSRAERCRRPVHSFGPLKPSDLVIPASVISLLRCRIPPSHTHFTTSLLCIRHFLTLCLSSYTL